MRKTMIYTFTSRRPSKRRWSRRRLEIKTINANKPPKNKNIYIKHVQKNNKLKNKYHLKFWLAQTFSSKMQAQILLWLGWAGVVMEMSIVARKKSTIKVLVLLDHGYEKNNNLMNKPTTAPVPPATRTTNIG